MSLKDIFIKNDEDEEEVLSTPEKHSVASVAEPVEYEQPLVSVDQPADIAAVYEKAGLADKSKSIFKVQQIRSSFPNTVADEVVKQALPGLLVAANLTAGDVRQDASMRISALSTALEEYSNESSTKIQTLTQEINDLAAQIEAKRQAITETQKSKENFEEAVNTEIKVLSDNLNYVPA